MDRYKKLARSFLAAAMVIAMWAIVIAAQFRFVAKRVLGIPIWIFHGDADTSVDVEESRKMAAALKSAGADVRYIEYPGVDQLRRMNLHEVVGVALRGHPCALRYD